jgi:hypothetical protein
MIILLLKQTGDLFKLLIQWLMEDFRWLLGSSELCHQMAPPIAFRFDGPLTGLVENSLLRQMVRTAGGNLKRIDLLHILVFNTARYTTYYMNIAMAFN